MSGPEMQKNLGSRVKTSGWHAGHPSQIQSRRFIHYAAGAPGSGVAARARQVAFRRNGRSNSWFSSRLVPYPASQGNRASSTAMARAVVSWGATRTGMGGGRGGRAGCARRLFRHALPEGVVARGSCEIECENSRPYCRSDTTFAPVGT